MIYPIGVIKTNYFCLSVVGLGDGNRFLTKDP